MSNLKPLIEPVVFSTTFSHRKPGQMGYGRVDNPTRLVLEKQLALLEGARFALAFSSGSAALAAVFSLLSVGDKVLSHTQVYEGTCRMLHDVFRRFGISNTSVDFSDARALGQFAKKMQMMICESVTNPCLVGLDIKKAARVKGDKTILVVDNTMMTPILVKPLEEGADIVVHSLTKFIAGHHDVIAGAVMTNSAGLYKRLRHIQWTLGAVPGPHDCFLVLRGMETLHLRMREHNRCAGIVAEFLEHHPLVEKVTRPPFSGMVSFWMKGDMKHTVSRLMRLKHVRIAHSFGGTRTTVLHPRSMMTWTQPASVLEKLGITGGLVRLSVGIGDPGPVIDDLRQALKS